MTYGIGNPGPGMGQVQNVTGLNWLIGSLHPPFLDNWIFNGKTDIKKQ
jgi:hypothetical protein